MKMTPTPSRRRRLSRGLSLGFIGLAAVMTLILVCQPTVGTLLATPALAEEDVQGGQTHEEPATEGTAEEELTQLDPVFREDPLQSLADSLKSKQRELEEREKALEEKEARLEALRLEIEENLLRSQRVLSNMERLAGEADVKRRQEVKKWVEIYQKMKPEAAGQILQGLEPEFQLELLAQMDTSKAAKILNTFPTDKAIELGDKLKPEY